MMEPITTAIVAAVTAGVSTGLTDVAKSTISDSYTKLKALIAQKLGSSNVVTQSIQQLEEEPDSEGWQKVLDERIKKAALSDDSDILNSAQALKAILEKHHVSHSTNILQVSGTGAVGQVFGGSVQINNKP